MLLMGVQVFTATLSCLTVPGKVEMPHTVAVCGVCMCVCVCVCVKVGDRRTLKYYLWKFFLIAKGLGCSSVVYYLPSMHEALGFISGTMKNNNKTIIRVLF
jgi:hypothetical protein